MSVVQACAMVEAALHRARSLFGAEAAPPAAGALGGIDTAAESTATTAEQTRELSGVAIARYQTFADQSGADLRHAAQTDAALRAHVASAAAPTQSGAQRLDAIAAQTRATTQAAATATTPAAQRTILAALRSQLAQGGDVVNTAKQQASGLATQLRALTYPLDYPQSSGPATPGDVQAPGGAGGDDMPFPAGPIVWCVRPEGVFGFWRCSVLYPDLSVGTYWSPTDDSGGSLP